MRHHLARPAAVYNEVHEVPWCDVSVLGLYDLPHLWMTRSAADKELPHDQSGRRNNPSSLFVRTLSEPNHEYKFQITSACMLVCRMFTYAKLVTPIVILYFRMLLVSDTEPYATPSYGAEQPEPCGHTLVSRSGHGCTSARLFAVLSWLVVEVIFFRFCPVKFWSWRLEARHVQG